MSFSGSFRNVCRDLWRLSNDRRICNVLSVIVVVAFAAFIVMLVVKGILNFRELSALRQPIRNLGGSVTTSGDGMGDFGGPSEVGSATFGVSKRFDNGALAQALPHLRKFPNLRSLCLRETAVTDASLDTLASLPLLSRLDLSRTAITDHGLAKLHALHNLRNLALHDTKVTTAGIQALKLALPKLTVE